MMHKPIIYSIIDKEQLNDMLKSFQVCLNLPIAVLDNKGHPLLSCGETSNFCVKSKKYLSKNNSCDDIYFNASRIAINLGESYIFDCPSKLSYIILPLAHHKVFFGSILVGPFVMGSSDYLLTDDDLKGHKITSNELKELNDEVAKIQVLETSNVTYASRLVYYMFSNLIYDSKLILNDNKKKLYQQSQINDSIQMFKSGDSRQESVYPLHLENKLVTKVKIGNINEANGALNELLGYVFFSEGNSLEVIKSRSIELCSLLSRVAIEGGAPTDNILKINNNFLKSIPNINNFESLCFKLQEVVETFAESMFQIKPSKNNSTIKQAIQYIAKNFSSNITLEEVAQEVHLNPSYFSSIFKEITGSSFSEYLNMVRVEESKRLLANTNYSIIDIAIATGFNSQSYFSKVFKKYTGLSPGQYR